MILVGMAPRRWVDRKTGEVQERTVLWLERQDVPDLKGQAFEETMVRNEMIPPNMELGDDIIPVRNSSCFIQQIVNLSRL